jgi:hypothetical protein
MKKLTILVLIIGLSLISSCSKKAPDEPENFISGYIVFKNSTQYYSITITQIVQRRSSESVTDATNLLVPIGYSRRLNNLIDGGQIFPGGDDVTITFESLARHPQEPENPLFERTLTLTVNGTQNIRVKGQQGEYDIQGGF